MTYVCYEGTVTISGYMLDHHDRESYLWYRKKSEHDPPVPIYNGGGYKFDTSPKTTESKLHIRNFKKEYEGLYVLAYQKDVKCFTHNVTAQPIGVQRASEETLDVMVGDNAILSVIETKSSKGIDWFVNGQKLSGMIIAVSPHYRYIRPSNTPKGRLRSLEIVNIRRRHAGIYKYRYMAWWSKYKNCLISYIYFNVTVRGQDPTPPPVITTTTTTTTKTTTIMPTTITRITKKETTLKTTKKPDTPKPNIEPVVGLKKEESDPVTAFITLLIGCFLASLLISSAVLVIVYKRALARRTMQRFSAASLQKNVYKDNYEEENLNIEPNIMQTQINDGQYNNDNIMPTQINDGQYNNDNIMQPQIDDGQYNTGNIMQPQIDDGQYNTANIMQPQIDDGQYNTGNIVQPQIDDGQYNTGNIVQPQIDDGQYNIDGY
uniref:Uncharacterized protein n=2 Tax=Clytia hemisphaerica TaxID=252671 RepID=A0A7M5V8U3_9CNID